MTSIYTFPSLCAVTGFVTNSPDSVLSITRDLSPSQASVFLDLVSSGCGFEHLSLKSDLPSDLADSFGRALSKIPLRSLLVCNPDREFICRPALLHAVFGSLTPALERLEIRSVNLAGDSKELGAAMSCCASLSQLTLRGCAVGGKEAVAALARGIEGLFSLTSLTLFNNRMGDSDVATLVGALTKLKALHTLKLAGQRIRAKGSAALGELPRIGMLRILELSDDEMGDYDISRILDGLADRGKSCELRRLSVFRNNFTNLGAMKVAEFVQRSSGLISLDMSNIRIGEPGTAELVGKAIAKSRIQEFEGSMCGLGPIGTAEIFKAMHCGQESLVSLTLGCNAIGDEGVHAMVGHLLASSAATADRKIALTTLNLANNEITEAGAMELAPALAIAPSLSVLCMAYNKICSVGMSAILDALASAGTLPMEKLDLDSCLLKDMGAEAAARLIARRGCRQLYLQNNSIDSTGVSSIAEVVSTAKQRIEVINLSGNWADIGPIIERLAKICLVVSTLRLKGLRMDDAAAKLLTKAIQEMPRDMALRKVEVFAYACTMEGRKALKKELDRERAEPGGVEVLDFY